MDWLIGNWGWLALSGGLLALLLSRRGHRSGHHEQVGDGRGPHKHGAPANDTGPVAGAAGPASHAGHSGSGRRHRHGC